MLFIKLKCLVLHVFVLFFPFHQGKGQRINYHAPSPPVSPRLALAKNTEIDEGCSEGAADSELSEHQQVAMQQEERVLTEQIESLQKEKYTHKNLLLATACF